VFVLVFLNLTFLPLEGLELSSLAVRPITGQITTERHYFKEAHDRGTRTDPNSNFDFTKRHSALARQDVLSNLESQDVISLYIRLTH